ncbi:FluG domain-containing protein [Dactylonectria macrodidyma]|uniref:FluG domain-containing protein n=1 Tax=Dactylonectria macrodidyma TaxID=307937 RepID=A0A9P9DSG2_9HYPO|nr:FluG domain-containing protein [Dactylonectria macrodidyma]
MLASKLSEDIGRQSLDSGHEKRWTPRFARRGARNAANGDAPDSVRDQFMRHDLRFVTFHQTYLNEIVNFDIQNAFLEEEKKTQLFRMFAYVSLTRDPRATADMVPPEVWDNVEPDPEIVELEEERARLKQGNYRIEGCEPEQQIRRLTNKIRTKRAQREKRIVREYREDYFYHRPTWDIERQASGEEEDDEGELVEPVIDLAIPERARLAEILCNQSADWTEEEAYRRRIEVIDLMVALCDKRETVKRDRIRLRTKANPPVKSESPEPEAKFEPNPDPFPLLMQATQCPDCVGNTRLTLEERAFTYCRPTVMNDHFDDQHLARRKQAEQSGETIRYEHPKCKNVRLQHLDHFQSHVQRVHSVTLRTSSQVKQRRQRKVRRRQIVRGKRPQ